jgi:hypothetical protein
MSPRKVSIFAFSLQKYKWKSCIFDLDRKQLWIPNCARRVIEEGGNVFVERQAQGTGETPHDVASVPKSHC